MMYGREAYLEKRNHNLKKNLDQLEFELKVFTTAPMVIGGMLMLLTFCGICVERLDYQYDGWWNNHSMLLTLIGALTVISPHILYAFCALIEYMKDKEVH